MTYPNRERYGEKERQNERGKEARESQFISLYPPFLFFFLFFN